MIAVGQRSAVSGTMYRMTIPGHSDQLLETTNHLLIGCSIFREIYSELWCIPRRQLIGHIYSLICRLVDLREERTCP